MRKVSVMVSTSTLTRRIYIYTRRCSYNILHRKYAVLHHYSRDNEDSIAIVCVHTAHHSYAIIIALFEKSNATSACPLTPLRYLRVGSGNARLP